MAEQNSNTVEKLVSLPILTYYDEQMKNWVLKRLSNIEGVGSLTEEELKVMIRTEVDNYNDLEII